MVDEGLLFFLHGCLWVTERPLWLIGQLHYPRGSGLMLQLGAGGASSSPLPQLPLHGFLDSQFCC